MCRVCIRSFGPPAGSCDFSSLENNRKYFAHKWLPRQEFLPKHNVYALAEDKENTININKKSVNVVTKTLEIRYNFIYGRNSFAERFKILAEYKIRKVILLNYQNNYVERSN